VASGAAVAGAAIRSARAGAVICLSGGSYHGLVLAGRHTGDITVEPVPGSRVELTPGIEDRSGDLAAVLARRSTSHIVLHGFRIAGMVELSAGDSFIRIDHNDIFGGPFGVRLDSTACTTPNAPRWPGCRPEPRISEITVSGNRIHDIGRAFAHRAININNYDRVRVTGNDEYGIVDEGGQHVDCLQSTFGGSNLIFDHNYEHDNNCQGFFTKDGDVRNAIVYDNLFLRDQVAHVSESNMDIVNVYHLIIRRNTSWPGTDDLLFDMSSARQPRAQVDHNVFWEFNKTCYCSQTAEYSLREADNVFARRPWTFTPARSDRVRRPRFVSPGSDDYRLVRNRSGIGVDWRPAAEHYGP
jgi:hypothetical protein